MYRNGRRDSVRAEGWERFQHAKAASAYPSPPPTTLQQPGRYKYPRYELTAFEQEETFMEGYDEGVFIELETFLRERGIHHLTKLDEKVQYLKEAASAR